MHREQLLDRVPAWPRTAHAPPERGLRRRGLARARVLEAGTEIMQVCVAAGGSLSGEHGIGIEKRDEMHRVFTEADLDAMLRMRAAWDPDERMNPGKAIPVRACMEVKTKPLPVAAGGDDS